MKNNQLKNIMTHQLINKYKQKNQSTKIALELCLLLNQNIQAIQIKLILNQIINDTKLMKTKIIIKIMHNSLNKYHQYHKIIKIFIIKTDKKA